MPDQHSFRIYLERAGDSWCWLQYLTLHLTSPQSEVDRDAEQAEINKARASTIEFQIQGRLRLDALNRWDSQNPPPPEKNNTWVQFAAWKSAQLAVPLAAVAALGYLLWRLLRWIPRKAHSAPATKLGLWRQAVAWLVALAGTLTVLGLCPAEVISPDV